MAAMYDGLRVLVVWVLLVGSVTTYNPQDETMTRYVHLLLVHVGDEDNLQYDDDDID